MKKMVLMLLSTVAIYSQTQNYTASTEVFSNPERGQYHYTTSGTDVYNLLNQTTLTNYRVNEKITLVWREFSLNNFKTTPISSTYLANMQTDFSTMRKAGVKCIVRFCYTHVDGTDASKAQILAHIEQLKPVLLANEDVISSMEAGFIGNYGEWYYSNNFGTETHTTQNTADRLEVGLKIMELTPHRIVAFRTPTFQRQIGGATALTASTAHNGSVNSRVAAHNDCFLSSSSDYGTYANTTTDYTYLENQSKYTFDGGETCSPTTYSECSNAVYTMNRFHFNYLNIDYNQSVISLWQTNGCYDEVRRKLGYRFELLNSNITNNTLTINLQNTGFANIFNDRKAYLVLRNTSTNVEYSFQLNTDVRLWQTGTATQIVQSLNLAVPQGTYKLYLNLPDPKIVDPLYSIQCANTGTWDAVKGYNNLNQTFTTTTTTATPDTTAPTASTISASGTTTSSTNLSWTAATDNTGVTGYNVYQNGALKTTTTATSLAVSGLSASTAYSFYVKAKDAEGNLSANSNTVSVTTLATPDTTAPTASTISASGTTTSSTNLSWTAATDNTGVTGYNVYQNGALKTTTTATSLAVSGLSASTAYSFYVKAKDAEGNLSANSNTVSVTTLTTQDTTAPTASTISASGTTTSSTNLSWTAATDNTGVAGYNVYQNGALKTTTTATSLAVSGLSASTAYSFYVKAKDAEGNLSANSNTVSVTTLATPDTTAPTASTISASGTTTSSTNLSWTAATDNTGVTGYNVYQNGALKTTTTATSLAVSGLSASTAYSFYVKAKDAEGNLSANSNTVSVTTLATPDTTAPTASTISASGTTTSSTNLSWTAATDNTGVTGYNVYQNGALKTTTTATSLAVSGLSASTAYSFYVKAKDAEGNLSANSNTVSVTTLVTPPVVTDPPTVEEKPAVAPVEIILVNNSIITVYNLPNPSFTVAVYSINGRLRSTSVDISDLRKGIYIVKVTSAGVVYTKKIVKQ